MLLICCVAATLFIIVLGAAVPTYESRPDAVRASGQTPPSTVTLNMNAIVARTVMATHQEMRVTTHTNAQ